MASMVLSLDESTPTLLAANTVEERISAVTSLFSKLATAEPATPSWFDAAIPTATVLISAVDRPWRTMSPVASDAGVKLPAVVTVALLIAAIAGVSIVLVATDMPTDAFVPDLAATSAKALITDESIASTVAPPTTALVAAVDVAPMAGPIRAVVLLVIVSVTMPACTVLARESPRPMPMARIAVESSAETVRAPGAVTVTPEIDAVCATPMVSSTDDTPRPFDPPTMTLPAIDRIAALPLVNNAASAAFEDESSDESA